MIPKRFMTSISGCSDMGNNVLESCQNDAEEIKAAVTRYVLDVNIHVMIAIIFHYSARDLWQGE